MKLTITVEDSAPVVPVTEPVTASLRTAETTPTIASGSVTNAGGAPGAAPINPPQEFAAAATTIGTESAGAAPKVN
jgi:hypothetical protein